MERDERGRLVGFGLTLHPTPHAFTSDRRTLYAWCATDALQFPGSLDRAGVVESTCPATGTRIRVELTRTEVLDVDPPEAVVSKVRPTEPVGDGACGGLSARAGCGSCLQPLTRRNWVSAASMRAAAQRSAISPEL